MAFVLFPCRTPWYGIVKLGGNPIFRVLQVVVEKWRVKMPIEDDDLDGRSKGMQWRQKDTPYQELN